MSAERLDAFMARANAAYYAARDPFADFTTAPEISQVFGELLGAWATVVWRSMGSPGTVVLAEAGPGRGTLMADAVRLIRRVAPDFVAALEVHLIETSPRLRTVQQAALPGLAPVWHDRVEDLPDRPLILLANEFLDALPIRQFRRGATGWEERHVAARQGLWHPAAPPERIAGHAVPMGDVVELCEPALAIVAGLRERLRRQPGAVLLLDYGPGEAGHGDSLQALRDAAPCDPFGAAGTADLTAHVDFPGLAEAAHGVRVHGPVVQGRFLAQLGLFERTRRLAHGRPAPEVRDLVLAARRLADPARMGTLFKAMALCHPDLGVPPGFAEETDP